MREMTPFSTITIGDESSQPLYQEEKRRSILLAGDLGERNPQGAALGIVAFPIS